MGSVDIPPFMREQMKKKQSESAEVPPFLKKKSGDSELLTGGEQPKDYVSVPQSTSPISYLPSSPFYQPTIEQVEKLPENKPMAAPDLSAPKQVQDNIISGQQRQKVQLVAKNAIDEVQHIKELPKRVEEYKKKKQEAQTKATVDDFDPQQFLQIDINGDGKDAYDKALGITEGLKASGAVSTKNIEDAASFKSYFGERINQLNEKEHLLREMLKGQQAKNLDAAPTRGDIAGQMAKPIDLQGVVKHDTPQNEQEITDALNTLKEYRSNLYRTADYYAKKLAKKVTPQGNNKDLGKAYGEIMNDPYSQELNRFEQKGIPIRDEDKLNQDLQGLEVRKDDLEERYQGKEKDDAYYNELYQIEQGQKDAIHKYPELKRQRIALLITQELGKDADVLVNAASTGDEKAIKAIADKTGLSKKDIVSISTGDLPSEGFLSNMGKAIYGAGTGILTGANRLIGGAFGADPDRLTYVNRKISESGNDIFGDNPYEHTINPETIVNSDLSLSRNPNAGKYNYNAASIKNLAGEAIGGLLGFVGGTKGLGYLGMDERAALWTNVIASGYENRYQQAAQVLGKDASEKSKNQFALITGAIEAAAFEFLPKEKLGLNLTKKEVQEFGDIVGKTSINNINKEALTKWTEKVLQGTLKSAGEAGKVTAAMSASKIVNGILRQQLGDKNGFDEAAGILDPHKLGEEFLGLMLPLSLAEIPQGMKHSRQFKESLYDAGSNADVYRTQIKQAVELGRMPEKEGELRLKTLDALQNISSTVPETNPETNQPLTHSQKVEYTYNRVKESAVQSKKEGIKGDEALAQLYNKNAKELVDERKSILNGTQAEYQKITELYDRVKEKESHNKTLAAGTKTEGIKYLSEQALTTPNGIKNTLKGDADLTTDLIAQNEPLKIKEEISKLKEKHAKLTDQEKYEEADALDKHITLLEEGLKKAKAEPPPLDIEHEGVIVTSPTEGGNITEVSAPNEIQKANENGISVEAPIQQPEPITIGGNRNTGTTAKLITEKENPNLNGKALIEVRDSDGNLIGNLGIHTNTGIYEKDGKKYASISGVSTTPEFRGKGRAIDLYRHALDEIKKLGFDGLYSDDAEVVDKKAINKIREKLIVEDLGNGEYLYLGIKGEKKGANGEEVKPEITQEPIKPLEPKQTEEVIQPETKVSEGGGGAAEPPKEIKHDFVYSNDGDKRVSGLMRHIQEAEGISEDTKKAFKEKGIEYAIADNKESRRVAQEIIKSLGTNDALQVARGEDMHPSVRSAIFAESIDNAFKAEQDAKVKGDKEAELKAAAEWASISREYDKKLTSGGQFTQYANHFYKTSSLGFVIKANAETNAKFEQFMEGKEENFKEAFEEFIKTDEGKLFFDEKVEAARKEERKAERKKRDKKIDDFFDGLKAKGDILYSAPIPPSVWNGAMDVMKTLSKGGDRAIDIVKAAIEHISKHIGEDWDKEKFRKEYEPKVKKVVDEKTGYKESEEKYKKRIEYLEGELQRIKDRKSKQPKEKKESTREVSDEEKSILEEISLEQDKWDAEKDAAREASNDYKKMETERNRQLRRIDEINEKIEVLKTGNLPETKKIEYKKDTPEIEALKEEKNALEKEVRESISHEKKIKELEGELQRIKDRREKEPKEAVKREIKKDEQLIRDEIESEKEKWDTEKRIGKLNEELQRLKNRTEKTKNEKEKKELTDAEKDILAKIKKEREDWAKEKEPLNKLRNALKAAAKSLADYTRRINEKDISKNEGSKTPETPELKSLREKVKEKRDEYLKMKKEMTREEDNISSIEDREKELKRRMDENDYSAEYYEPKRPTTEKEKAALEKYKKTKELYDEAKKKSKEWIDKKAKQYLDQFRTRLSGMDDAQKEEVIRRSAKKLIENGALRYEEFRSIIADVMGFKELTPDQIKRAEELVKEINSLDEVEAEMVNNPTRENIDKLEAARRKSIVAQLELYNMTSNKSDIVQTVKSLITGNLMGIPTLFVNLVANPIYQMSVRFPKDIIKNIGEYGLYAVTKAANAFWGSEVYNPKVNAKTAQEGYWKMGKKGLKNAIFNFKKGTENKDYFGNREYQSALAPKVAKAELQAFKRGEIYLDKNERIDRWLRKSWMGRQADFILRGMQFGDNPPRWAAEGAKAIQIAKQELKLEDVNEVDAFMLAPEKYAKKVFLKQGYTEAKANQLAKEVQERIVFEGEKAVLQEDNLLSKASSYIDSGLRKNKNEGYGMSAAKGTGAILKTITFPFVKIPANFAWQAFKLAVPEVALGQAAIQYTKAFSSLKKGDRATARKYLDRANDSFAHATLGLTMRLAAQSLVAAGYTRSSNDEDTKSREREGERTYGKQNQVNLGKLMGGGDLWVDFKYFGPFGVVLNTQSQMSDEQRQQQAKDNQGYVEDLIGRVNHAGIEQLNNLVFNSGGKLVDAMKGGEKPFQNWAVNSMNTLSNVFTGATYVALSKALLPEQVRVNGDGVVNDILNNQKQRNVLFRLATDALGGKGNPPSKVSIWGEPIKNDRSVTGIMGAMLGWEKDSKDIFGAILYDDYRRTGDAKFFPTTEDNKLSVNGKQITISREEQDRLNTLVGQARKTLVRAFVYDQTDQFKGKVYSQLSDEEKTESLQTVYDLGKEIGYKQFKQENPKYDYEVTKEEKQEKKEESRDKKIFKKQLQN